MSSSIIILLLFLKLVLRYLSIYLIFIRLERKSQAFEIYATEEFSCQVLTLLSNGIERYSFNPHPQYDPLFSQFELNAQQSLKDDNKHQQGQFHIQFTTRFYEHLWGEVKTSITAQHWEYSKLWKHTSESLESLESRVILNFWTTMNFKYLSMEIR